MPIRVKRLDGSAEPGLSYMRVKVKSLAAEAKIIRQEAAKPGAPRHGLHMHRRTVVRTAARHALLAYGFMKGRNYREIEAKTHEKPHWPTVLKMVDKYGTSLGEQESYGELQARRKLLNEEFAKWAE